MTTFLRHQLWPAIALLIALTLITGVAYPAVVTADRPGRVPEPGERLVHRSSTARRVGSSLIGQASAGPEVLLGPAVSRRRDDGSAATTAWPRRAPTSARRTRTSSTGSPPTSTHSQAANGGGPVPVDLVTTSASGLDPDISPAGAEYQVARVAAARGMTEDEVRAAVARHTEQPLLGFLGQPRVHVLLAEPRPRRRVLRVTDRPERDALDVRPTADEMLARIGGDARPAGPAARLPRDGAGRRQDLPDARRGPPPPRPRHGPRRRVRRGSRPTAHRRAPRRPRDRARGAGSSTAASSSRRWTPTRSSPAGPTVALDRRARPHQRAGLGAREALGGRRGHPRRRHPRRQHAATSSTSRASPTRSRRSPARRSTSASPTRSSLDADEIELVDMSPHALRQRMKHGNVYPPERTQVALERFFTEANLTALRELALRLVARRVEGQLEDTTAGPAAAARHRARRWSWSTAARRRCARSAGRRSLRRAARRPSSRWSSRRRRRNASRSTGIAISRRQSTTRSTLAPKSCASRRRDVATRTRRGRTVTPSDALGVAIQRNHRTEAPS